MLLISPDQAFNGLYPYPVHHLYDCFSMVNFEKPRLDVWPRFSNVRGQLAILSPGSVLYVPPFWCVPKIPIAHRKACQMKQPWLHVNLMVCLSVFLLS